MGRTKGSKNKVKKDTVEQKVVKIAVALLVLIGKVYLNLNLRIILIAQCVG